jgi:hypothetical protein
MNKHLEKSLLVLLCCFIGACIFVYSDKIPVFAGDDNNELAVKWILPPKYYYGGDFREGKVWVREKEGGPWTLFDDQGNIIKDGVEAELIIGYKDGLSIFIENLQKIHDYGFLNSSGDVVSLFSDVRNLPPMFRSEGGLIRMAGENNSLGFMNVYGEWVISPDYENVREFRDGLCPVAKDGKYGYIDRSGNIVINYRFDYAFPFLNGIAAVKMDSMFGIIDTKGDWIAEPIYEAYGFSGAGPITLKKDGKVGFIDMKGNVIIDFKFEFGPGKGNLMLNYCFFEDRAYIPLNKNEFGIINTSGDMLFSIVGKPLSIFKCGYLFFLKEDGKIGIVDRDGRHYSLPPDFITPTARVRWSGDNIFCIWDETVHNKIGYFAITNYEGEI